MLAQYLGRLLVEPLLLDLRPHEREIVADRIEAACVQEIQVRTGRWDRRLIAGDADRDRQQRVFARGR